MIITLIKSTQMFSLTLPQRVKGQYWLTDLDEKGRLRQLASIEAIDEKMVSQRKQNGKNLRYRRECAQKPHTYTVQLSIFKN